MAATEEELARMTAQIEQTSEAFARLTGTMFGHSEEQLKAAKADKDAKDAAALFALKMDIAADAAKSLAGIFVNYQKEVYKGGSANKAAAASIESMGDAAKYAGAFLALLVPGGPLVKGLVAGIGLLTSELIKSGKLIAEQTDDIYKAYQDMAKAGATGAGGMQDVFDSLQKVGMGTEKFGAYIKLVNENANDLAMFGGSVNKGRKIFENTMASLSKDQRVQMEQMGLDREAQSQATMAYLKQQRLLTAGTKAQMDTSSTAVMKYVAETDALTRITGANREEQQKILDEAMAEDIFGSFLDNMRSQGEEGRKKAEQIQNAVIMQEKMYGKQSAKGLRDSLTGFLGTSKENEKFFMSYGEGGQQLIDVLRNVNATNDDMYTAMKAQAASGKELNESMAGVTGMGVAGDTFVLYKERRLAEQNFNKDLGKLFAEANAERLKQIADPKTKEAAEAENNVRETQLKQQRLVNLGMDAYISTSHSASKANLALAEAALAAARALGAIGGKKPPTRAEQTKTASRAAAANEVKSGRIGPEEAKAILENGSDRDIADFGGRESLEKIAGSAPAKPPAAPSRGRGAPPAPTKGKGAAPATPAPAAAPAGGGAPAPAAPAPAPAGGGAPAPAAPAPAPAGGGAPAPAAPAPAPAGGGAPAPAATSATSPAPTSSAAKGQQQLLAGMPVPPKPIEKILDTRPGEITVETPDGDKQKRMGTAAWRMNNPGNLRGKGTFISQMPGYIGEGDAGPSGFFSVFRTKDDGAKAREALLFSGRSKIYTPETSIREAMSRYAPPSENNTDAYVRLVAEAMGVPDTTKIKDLTSGQKSAWLDAITKHEGNREGKTIQAADGGVFSGPKSGYSATLHGDEAVIPLKGGAVPVHINSKDIDSLGGGYNELKGYTMGAISTDLAVLEKIAGKLGAYDKSTEMITDPKLWKEIVQSGMLMNYDLGAAKIGTRGMSEMVGSEAVADALAGRIKELIDTKKDSSEAVAQTRTEFADMMKTFYEDFFAKMQAQMAKENPLDSEMLAVLKDISRTNAAAAGSSEKMLRYTQN